MKKIKSFRLKMEQDGSFVLRPNRPFDYRGQGVRERIILRKPQLAWAVLERVWDESIKTDSLSIFFSDFKFSRGSIGFELCDSCWALI